jgi:hypothetical protein
MELAGRVMARVLCDATLRALGTARHEEIRERLRLGQLTPGYAFSEVGGGVNTKVGNIHCNDYHELTFSC